MKPVMIGECPSPVSTHRGGWPTSNATDEPLGGSFGKRIAELSGQYDDNLEADVGWFFENFLRVNLCHKVPFNIKEARQVNYALKWVLRDSVVLLAGRKVESFFFRNPDRFFKWRLNVHGHGAFVTVPHPSGKSRWWNEDVNHERARRFFETLSEDIIKKRVSPEWYTSKQ